MIYTFCTFIAFLYFLQIYFYNKYFKKILTFEKKFFFNKKIFISILVAVRDEEKNIFNLLNSIFKQNFPKKNFELILVDDFSEDKTSEIIEKFIEKTDNFLLLKLKNKSKNGKKYALKKAIKKSKGNLIITTDADCIMGTNWLITIASYYEKFRPKMIVAPVLLKGEKTLFQKMQSLEFLSLIASSAGAIGMKKAIMCNGANLIYEKKIINDDFFFEKSVSGDDIFLMLNLKKKYKNQIHFLKSKDAIVFTKSQKTFSDFIEQRKRWTSKSKFYKDFDIIYVSILIFLNNFLLFLNFILSFFEKKYFFLFLILFFTKFMMDFIFLRRSSKFFEKKFEKKIFFILQFIYPFYIVFIALYGNFSSFIWKKRKIKFLFYFCFYLSI